METIPFFRGDITELAFCERTISGAEVVLHQAAIGSVPRSVEDPITTNEANVTGFLNCIVSAKNEGVSRFVYASSSSVYGDHPQLPKIEGTEGKPLSPYAASKLSDENYAASFSAAYDLCTVGLRYFNVFGPRQNPHGDYSAVIPRWIAKLLGGEHLQVFGDGSSSRDFCFVKNVVQANLLAGSLNELSGAMVLNIAAGARTSLKELDLALRGIIDPTGMVENSKTQFEPSRLGDVKHSWADITMARETLGYQPSHDVRQGLLETVQWYREQVQEQNEVIRSKT